MTFLTIFTRHMASRPGYYARHCASLEWQTCRDFEHLVIEDDTGRGIAWAQQQIPAHAGEVQGDYVQVLNDDDVLAGPRVVALIRAAALHTGADIIVHKTDSLEIGIIPDTVSWLHGPVCGHMSDADVTVRRDVWRRHVDAYQSGRYTADFDFLCQLWRGGYRVHWLDMIAVKCLRVSRGRAE